MKPEHRPILRLIDRPQTAGAEPTPTAEVAVRMLRSLIRTRLLAARMSELQASRDIGYHPPTETNAAAVVAACEALGESGFLFSGNRHLAAFVHRGVPLERYLDHAFGNCADTTHGHQMPGFYTARRERIATITGPTLGHLVHGVGFAWAAQQRGESLPVGVLFGGAGVDSAEFHNALNFAGVLKAPVVFVALSRGLREPPIADLGVAYGVSTTCCDGSDVYAVYHAVRRGIDARAPHLVEALLEPEHDGEARLRRSLEASARWSPSQQRETEDTLRAALDRAVAQASRRAPPEPGSIFADLFATLPPILDAQRSELTQP